MIPNEWKPLDIQAALALAVDITRWPEGRVVFDPVRQPGLDKDKPLTAAEDLCFRLAELVAKLAHTAAGPPSPFDYHEGWQVGPIAYRLAGESKDPAPRHRLAAALDGWPEAE
ncbi:hypothetical protein [Streptomyces sp. NBC_01176]|uniref:hypothetical protein n=1 Tax=Streptomyces sp. NBC_01176 TaxID=2903760 RepID=UPI0038687858|nr:hypothetical protein OG199_04880 [Streptomyces sp. NBC_01176]